MNNLHNDVGAMYGWMGNECMGENSKGYLKG